MRWLRTLWLGLALPLAARGADVQKGYTFSDGNRVFASQLNALVDSATILPGFYTGHPANTTLDGADVFLVLSSGVFKRITAGNALLNNSALITGQAEKTAPTNTDYVLLYDAAATTLKKASVGNLSLGTTNLIAWQLESTNPAMASYLLVLNYGTNSKVQLTNLLWQFDYAKPFTNLAAHTAPTNADKLLIWDSTGAANKTTTLAGLITNLPATTTVTNTDTFPMFASNGVLSRVALTTLQTTISNNIIQTGSGLSQGWAKFWGTNANGTYSPLGGYNVSNVVRTAQGHYTLNFTNAMASTNYGVNVTLGGMAVPYFPSISTQNLQSVSIEFFRDAGSSYNDPTHAFVQIYQ